MFLLRSLGRLVMGGSNAADLLLIEDGEAWKLQTRVTSKGKVITRTKLEGKITLVLRRETGEFNYVLCFRDIDENELEGARFPLDKSLEFKQSLSEDDVPKACFVWRDSRFGDNDLTEYEFIWPHSTSSATAKLFHSTLAQCLFEAINKRSLEGASEADVQALMVVEEFPASPKPASIEGKVVYKSDQASFYVFDASTGLFVPKCDAVFAYITETTGKKAFEYTLSVLDIETNTMAHQQAIDPDATLHTDRFSFSFIWTYFTSDALVWTFSLRFTSVVPLMGFSNAMAQAVYQILNKEEFDKVQEDEARYMLNPFLQDVEMAGPSDEEQELSETGSEGEEEEEEDHRISHGAKSDKNAQLAVGFKHDRSFVSRGHSIGVFKHEDDKLKLSANIDKVKTTSGKLFTPSKMMLHQEDASLLLMNPDDEHKIYKMDLDRGSVVEEWNIHPDASVKDIIPDSKYAQMTGTQTLIGINDNSLFRIDPRLGGNKRVDSEMKQYAVKYGFTRGATTGKGELALASAKGEIRLFDKIDKRAKTLLPGFGDPIVGIDVTESGRLIVATCKNYLLLINTEIERGVQGFTKSMGKDKPAPIRLQLKPEHIQYMGQQVSFTPARFSTGSAEERSIITSTGPYVITWNLRRVKQGKIHEYQIKKYEDTVVADNFRFGQDRNIVVTLPDHVTMISKKSLSSPVPAVFSKKRGGNVVDSPF